MNPWPLDASSSTFAALEDRLAPHAQHPAGVVAGAAVHLDELVEQGGLLALDGAPVPFDGLCGDRLSLTHAARVEGRQASVVVPRDPSA